MHPSGKIKGLDGLRGIAIFYVLIEHRLGIAGAPYGAYGVGLFFVLSGFLIVGILRRDRAIVASGEVSASAAYRRFLVNRSLRIFPAYFTMITVAVLLDRTLAPGLLSPGELLYDITFTTNFFHTASGGWSPSLFQFWSLTVEEQFYLFVGPLILFGAIRSHRLCLLLVGTAVASAIYAATRQTYGRELFNSSFFAFGAIAVGGLLHGLKPDQWRKVLAPWTPGLAVLMYLAFPLLVRATFGTASMVFLPVYGLSVLLFGWLVLAIWVHQDSVAVRLLELRPLVGLGVISYGAYVYHGFLTPLMIKTLTGGMVDLTSLSPMAQFAGTVAVTLLVARASWLLIEAPALRLKGRLVMNAPTPEPLLVSRLRYRAEPS